jgi:hypothetical protein
VTQYIKIITIFLLLSNASTASLGTKDTEYFQPEQKLFLQELVQDRCDFEGCGLVLCLEVLVP